jgi:hypothetical protein
MQPDKLLGAKRSTFKNKIHRDYSVSNQGGQGQGVLTTEDIRYLRYSGKTGNGQPSGDNVIGYELTNHCWGVMALGIIKKRKGEKRWTHRTNLMIIKKK